MGIQESTTKPTRVTQRTANLQTSLDNTTLKSNQPNSTGMMQHLVTPKSSLKYVKVDRFYLEFNEMSSWNSSSNLPPVKNSSIWYLYFLLGALASNNFIDAVLTIYVAFFELWKGFALSLVNPRANPCKELKWNYVFIFARTINCIARSRTEKNGVTRRNGVVFNGIGVWDCWT